MLIRQGETAALRAIDLIAPLPKFSVSCENFGGEKIIFPISSLQTAFLSLVGEGSEKHLGRTNSGGHRRTMAEGAISARSTAASACRTARFLRTGYKKNVVLVATPTPDFTGSMRAGMRPPRGKGKSAHTRYRPQLAGHRGALFSSPLGYKTHRTRTARVVRASGTTAPGKGCDLSSHPSLLQPTIE